MIREGEYFVDNIKYRKIVFYNIESGDIEEIFNSIPTSKRLEYNNRDFLYSQILTSEDESIITIYDMITKKETRFVIDIRIDDKCKLLRIDRATEVLQCDSNINITQGSYYISIYYKALKEIHNYHLVDNKIVKKWVYCDWIPNIKRITFRGPTGYILLCNISVYDMDKREIISADKHEVFDSLLNFEQEYDNMIEPKHKTHWSVSSSMVNSERSYQVQPTEDEYDLKCMRIVYYRLLQLSEPFAYILNRWLNIQHVY